MDIASEIERFKSDWEVDFAGKRILRRSQRPWKRLVECFRKPKYPIIALYRFAQQHLDTERGIVYPNFIERGRGNEIAGVPSWYELSEERVLAPVAVDR